jgi:hypothetical protein
MFSTADDQRVVRRHEEEVDDKISGYGARQRRPQSTNHRGDDHRDEVQQDDIGGQPQSALARRNPAAATVEAMESSA